MSIFIKDIEYKIIKELSKENYIRVTQVEKDNKYYVIKEIKSIDLTRKDIIKDIQKEIEILSKYNFKCAIKYYDSFLIGTKLYILMEYCDGINLNDFIINYKNKNELIEEKILYNIIKQICLSMKEIYEKKNNKYESYIFKN